MEPEITPTPSEAEREAIEVALESSADETSPAAYRSPWRRAALEEQVEPEPD
jgi:hypothetical protein